MNQVWVLLALMSLAAGVAVALPAWRNRTRTPARKAFDLEVYRDQLGELDRDVARGIVSAGEARQARLEIERRILRAAGEAEPEAASAPRGRPWIAIGVGVALPVTALLLYVDIGKPTLPAQPFAEREVTPAPVIPPEVTKMIATLQQRLKDQPNDLRGWTMLGRSLAVTGDPAGSLAAYRKAEALAPSDPEALGGLGEALTVAAAGTVTPEAAALFQRLLAVLPDEPYAGYYLGLASAQSGDLPAAIEQWRRVLANGAANAPWRQQVTEALRTVAAQAGVDPAPILAAAPGKPPAAGDVRKADAGSGTPAQPGPTAEDMAAAAKLTPAERMANVRSMVDRLQARLDVNGDDFEGWMRLGQARAVLGEGDASAKAFEKAMALRPDDLDVVKAYARSRINETDPATDLPHVDDRAKGLFEQARKLRADDPEALWFLGVRALQDGDKSAAAADWERVLALLDPTHPDYALIKDRLDKLRS